MKIQEVKICNWRSIKDLSIHFQDLMIFIGQNNHGKSNILSAILFFFGELKAQELDFNRGAQELYVEVIFSDLDERDRATFKKYLTADGKIHVRKTAYLSGNFEYKGYTQNPREPWLQEINASAYTKRETAASFPFHPFLPTDGRLSKQNILDAQAKYIEANLSSIEFDFQLEDTNFLGLKSVAKGIFGEVYFIPAIKDASEDFSSKETSPFGKLYSSIIDAMSESNSDWKETKLKLGTLFNTLNKFDAAGQQNPNRPTELGALEIEMNKELATWGAEIDVEVTAPNIDDVFRANTQVWVNDGVRTDIRRKGHGLQRALTFALITVISNKLKSEKESISSEEAATRAASASSYYILEEPELYLHPQAQRALFDSLVGLSESKKQVLLCTHASALIEVEKYKSICIVKKENDSIGTKVSQCVEELFTENLKQNFNLSYWINPDRSELFFARKVILVEGPTDKTVIPLLARQLGIFRYDYTLVDCGSKLSIPLYCQLLNKFQIPYVTVYDKDHQKNKDAEGIASADKSTADIEASIDSSIGQKVVFINDIEEELGLAAGGRSKPYMALLHVTTKEFSISESLEAKLRAIYAA